MGVRYMPERDLVVLTFFDRVFCRVAVQAAGDMKEVPAGSQGFVINF